MPRNTPSVAGFVLAGGQSSRMGTNKALLRFDGESLVELGLGKLRQVCAQVAIAGGVAELRAFGTVIEDRYPGQGPLGGIVSALSQSTAEWNLFLAVDMPLLPVEALRALVEVRPGQALITLARAGDQVQPLCGLYSLRAHATLQAELQKGNRRVRLAAEATGSVAYWQAPEANWFTNVNTPQEFTFAENLAHSTGR